MVRFTRSNTSLITFDTYGTLIDWDAALKSYLDPLLRQKGVGQSLESFYDTWYYRYALPALHGPFLPYRELLRNSLQQALLDAGVRMAPCDGADFGDAMAAAEPFPDARDVLARLGEHYRLATISNSQHDIIRHAAKKLGDPFEVILTGEDTHSYKPHPELFERVLETTGTTAANTVHVAQSQYVDLQRSISMGIPTIWVNRQAQRRRPDTPVPELEIRNLEPLPEIFGIGATAGTAEYRAHE